MSNFFSVFDNSEQSSKIIHVPHGATWIPSEYATDFLLDEVSLAAEASLMSDRHTIELAMQVYAKSEMPPSMFINRVSRLVFDAERFDDETEEMNAVGMGVLYTRTSDQAELRKISSSRATQLKSELYFPYSQALSLLVNKVLQIHKQVSIIDFHSYSKEALPYELHKDQRRPEICIGVDKFHTPQSTIDLVQQAFSGFDSVEINEPFSGSYVPLEHFGKNELVKSFMLEIRKDVFHTKADRIQAALTDLITKLD